MKTAGKYLEEAHAIVERITPEQGIERHGAGNALFVDVRDSAAIEKSGTIAGALRIPRGFLEFAACDTSQYYNPAMKRDAEIVLVCGAGGQAALAGKTLKEMGYAKVYNVGGIGDWEKAGGPMEK
ncbi:rhodanese-like domain-containing protein [Halovulum dunhuangense]|uniref:Rhodanese-like domain-containing protein n=1 Tax=Halovulum dunhuangense TaxID=1505036 RepID=A0A849L4W5_9RHOB|nr:rhodanese-like domain-containing protein [Halovulum dunhuangense]NNU81405.1 rhodanese-like domain-containing protein [Halovulum dunhuangense]